MLREGAVDAREFTGSRAVILPVEGGWSARVSEYDVWPVRVFGSFFDALEWRDREIAVEEAAKATHAAEAKHAALEAAAREMATLLRMYHDGDACESPANCGNCRALKRYAEATAPAPPDCVGSFPWDAEDAPEEDGMHDEAQQPIGQHAQWDVGEDHQARDDDRLDALEAEIDRYSPGDPKRDALEAELNALEDAH